MSRAKRIAVLRRAALAMKALSYSEPDTEVDVAIGKRWERIGSDATYTEIAEALRLALEDITAPKRFYCDGTCREHEARGGEMPPCRGHGVRA